MDDNRYSDFWNFIKLLSDNDALDHVVVIGSWAEYLYSQCGVLKGFDANLRTLDIDFLVKNMRKPYPEKNIVLLAKEAGYVVEQDRLTGATKIFTPDFMEVEFLITQQGAGTEQILHTNLGVNAQALRHISILKDNIITVDAFGMNIQVPEPEAYAIHKMIINRDRKDKMQKDREAVLRILPFLRKDRCAELYQVLSRKEKAKCEDFFTGNGNEPYKEEKESINEILRTISEKRRTDETAHKQKTKNQSHFNLE